jgi:diaminohydroxyphosphoribosylaminopyrimidine deaminase/5-amino-6-(5-phosphoribosylamino)uracil reductase
MPTSDEIFMRGAFALARRALGQTWPNPAVGSVVVRPDGIPEVIARGATMPGGRPHAERVALEMAGDRSRGCTLYVTLEPCAHHGETPPCVDAIMDTGIGRVVCSAHDPDPRVAGAGIARLREAGIEVVEGVLEEEGARLSLGHALRVTRNRPLVQLKLAVGSDGLVPRGTGTPVWVTGEEARGHGHLLRARADAILVGRGTVAADNPALTCRLPGMLDRSPVRVVLDSKPELSVKARLLSDLAHAPVWLFCTVAGDGKAVARLEAAGVEVIEMAGGRDGGIDPLAILTELAQRGITRLLIEGGPSVAGSFWNADLVDEIYIYQGPEPAGSDGLKALSPGGLEVIVESDVFTVGETRTLGRDRLTVYHRMNA